MWNFTHIVLFQEAGLAVGGEDFNPYVMLEVHYNNEKKESGERIININVLYVNGRGKD